MPARALRAPPLLLPGPRALLRPLLERGMALLLGRVPDGQWTPGQRVEFEGDAAPIETELKTLSYVNERHDPSASTGTLAMPDGVAAGDLLVCSYRYVGNSAPPETVPDGWTEIGSFLLGESPVRHTELYRIATGTEAPMPSLSGSIGARRVIAAFHGNKKISVVTPSGFTHEATSTNPGSQVQEVATDSIPLPAIVFGAWWNENLSTVNPRTMSPAKDQEISIGTNGGWFGWKIFEVGDTPADVTVDMDDEGSENTLMSYTLSLA